MVQGKNEKIASLMFAAVTIMLSVFYTPVWEEVGVWVGSPFYTRLTYSFFHASVLHAFCNVAGLLSVVYLYDFTWRKCLLAYIIAVLVPEWALTHTPTVGLSAVCFALFGMLIFNVRDKAYLTICITFNALIGLFLPNVSGALHIYSYLAGLFVGFINHPFVWLRR